VHHGR